MCPSLHIKTNFTALKVSCALPVHSLLSVLTTADIWSDSFENGGRVPEPRNASSS